MKIIFFGTGSFALPTIKRLLNTKRHQVAAVVTQPDSKRGRGWNTLPSPVKAHVEKAAPGMTVLQPKDLRDGSFIETLRGPGADVFVVVDYGRILGPEILKIPVHMCVNLHPSLLPKYRGASPVNRAILNGDKETGNTVIKMSSGMDAGEIIARESMEIGPDENATVLLERLAESGSKLVVKTLDMIASGEVELEEQDEASATYAPRITKAEGEIRWHDDAGRIRRMVLAMQPWPGAFTSLDGKNLKIYSASVVDDGPDGARPGTVIDAGSFVVQTGKGALRVETLQLEGKKKMNTAEFVRGHDLETGTVLGTDEGEGEPYGKKA